MDGWTHLLQSKSSISPWRLLLSDSFLPNKDMYRVTQVASGTNLGFTIGVRGHCCTCGCCMCWPVCCWCRFVMSRVDLNVKTQPWGWPETWGAVTKRWYLKRGEWKPTVHKEISASDYYIIPQTHGNIYSAVPARWKVGQRLEFSQPSHPDPQTFGLYKQLFMHANVETR